MMTRPADYHSDFYSWSLEQARLVRDGSWAQLDQEHIAEEIEGLALAQFNKLENAFRVLLLDILKWEHQSELRSRNLTLSIEVRRIEVEDILSDNPGLRPRIGEAIARAYRKARLDAANESGLEETTYPEVCPYSFEDISFRAFTV